MEEEKRRAAWHVGSALEIYSNSKQRWHVGWVVAQDQSGELHVIFDDQSGMMKSKTPRRDDTILAPVGKHTRVLPPYCEVSSDGSILQQSTGRKCYSLEDAWAAHFDAFLKGQVNWTALQAQRERRGTEVAQPSPDTTRQPVATQVAYGHQGSALVPQPSPGRSGPQVGSAQVLAPQSTPRPSLQLSPQQTPQPSPHPSLQPSPQPSPEKSLADSDGPPESEIVARLRESLAQAEIHRKAEAQELESLLQTLRGDLEAAKAQCDSLRAERDAFRTDRDAVRAELAKAKLDVERLQAPEKGSPATVQTMQSVSRSVQPVSESTSLASPQGGVRHSRISDATCEEGGDRLSDLIERRPLGSAFDRRNGEKPVQIQLSVPRALTPEEANALEAEKLQEMRRILPSQSQWYLGQGQGVVRMQSQPASMQMGRPGSQVQMAGQPGQVGHACGATTARYISHASGPGQAFIQYRR